MPSLRRTGEPYQIIGSIRRRNPRGSLRGLSPGPLLDLSSDARIRCACTMRALSMPELRR